MAELYRSDICEVDVGKSLVRSYAGIVLATGDCKANRFGAVVVRNGEPVDLSTAAVTGYFIRPNYETVVCEGAKDGNVAYVDLPAACYTQDGTFSLAIKIVSTEVTQTVRVIDGCIRLTQTDTLIDPGEVVPSLETLFAHIAEMEAATEAANKAAEEADAATESLTNQVNAAIANMSAKVNEAAPSIIQESSGGLVSISDAANRNAQAIVSEIKPSVNGVSAVTLTRTGRNLVSNLDYIVQNGHSNTVITADVIDVKSPTKFDYGRIPITFKAGVTYTLVIDWEVYGRADAESGNTRASYYVGKAGTAATNVYIEGNGSKRIVRQYTFAEDTVARISWCPNQDGDVAARSRSRIMLLDGAYTADTAPEFVPCDKQTMTASLPETVYGGTLDWTTGLLTITHGADGAALADPVTHQLDAQTVEMLKGHNAVWSDTGDTSVVYVADTKLYIDNRFTALQNAILAMGADI